MERQHLLNFLKLNKIEILEKSTVSGPFDKLSSSYLVGSFNGNEQQGIGVSASRDHSLFISLAELCERFVMKFGLYDSFCVSFDGKNEYLVKDALAKSPNFDVLQNKTSNGLAAHTDLESAKEGALAELIERHVILKALIIGVSPTRLKKMQVKVNIDEYFKFEPDFHPSFFKWEGPLGHKVVVLIFRKGDRHLFSFGCSLDLKKACTKAVLEMHLRYRHISNEKFLGLKLRKSNKHFLFHYEGKGAWTKNFFFDTQYYSKSEVDTGLSKSDFFWRAVKWPDLERESPFVFVQCFSPKVMPLFKGPWCSSVINPYACPIDRFPPDLHPIG